MVNRFYHYLEAGSFEYPDNADELDFLASEFINHLWSSGDSLGYANDFISGLSRFLPRSRHMIPTARQYVKNWGRTITRKKALPITSRIVRALAGVAIMEKRPRLAATFLVGFSGLLRTDEMTKLVKNQVQFNLDAGMSVITLGHTKRSQVKNNPEQVIIRDPKVTKLLYHVMKDMMNDEEVYEGNTRHLGEDLRWAARKFGLEHARLTPYAFRRGGATHYFLQCGSLDRTAELGRWQDVKTARLYIEGAAAELGDWGIEAKGQEYVERLGQVCKNYIRAL